MLFTQICMPHGTEFQDCELCHFPTQTSDWLLLRISYWDYARTLQFSSGSARIISKLFKLQSANIFHYDSACHLFHHIVLQTLKNFAMQAGNNHQPFWNSNSTEISADNVFYNKTSVRTCSCQNWHWCGIQIKRKLYSAMWTKIKLRAQF